MDALNFSPKLSSLKKLSVWFGSLSLLSLFALKLITLFIPQDAYFNDQVRLTLVSLIFLPLPGVVLALLAILMGAVAYKKEGSKVALTGLVLGVLTIVVFFSMALSKDGVSFRCAYVYSPTEGNDRCSVLQLSGWQCSSYAGFSGMCVPPHPVVTF